MLAMKLEKKDRWLLFVPSLCKTEHRQLNGHRKRENETEKKDQFKKFLVIYV